jgi:hypothetical protein
MKREFGKKLIEVFFPKFDLTHVIDTSGAYIPGHGTPTVILFGRSRKPVGETVRAVLGVKGEPSTPEVPSNGLVWQSILQQIDRTNSQDEYTSTADVSRTTFASHPWSIGGGGAAELKEQLEASAAQILSDLGTDVGVGAVTRENDVYLVSASVTKRHSIPESERKDQVTGDQVRDWTIVARTGSLWPYHPATLEAQESKNLRRFLWSWKAQLSQRVAFGLSQLERGLAWFEYSMFFKDRYRVKLSIVFPLVATHNHFVLDRGGVVFNHSAPIIKLPSEAGEDDHLALIGLLNSSTACFWMKQVFFPKGGDHVGQEGARVRRTWWDERYEFAGTQLQGFPVPEHKPLALALQLNTLGRQYSELMPDAVVAAAMPTSKRLADGRTKTETIRGRMIALQEELDWQCYQLYGLLAEDLRYTGDDLPELALGQRAFEIVMARDMSKGDLQTTWFERHGSQPITELPTHWPADYRKLVERRIKLIKTNKEIGLIEKPEYKRRWSAEPWEQQEQQALRTWLLDCLEQQSHGSTPELTTVARLADKASSSAEFMQVAALYRGRPGFDVAALVAELVESEAVPFLPVLRYKPSGLRKREVWERTWDLQREEDRLGQKVEQLRQQVQACQKELAGKPSAEVDKALNPLRRDIQTKEQEWKEFGRSIGVPPKYTTADFQKTDYWRLRGKLDVPKERWVSYPLCQTESDPSLVIGWAGWNHLEQATALVGYYDTRKREGWDARQLAPLLAGLDQLLPWIHQWHPEIDKEFGETAGQSFQTMLEHDAHELGLTLEEIRAWKPEPRTTRTPRKKKGELP